MTAGGVSNSLNERGSIWTQFPCPLDRLFLSWRNRAGSFGIRAPHSIITLRTTFYERLLLIDHLLLPFALRPMQDARPLNRWEIATMDATKVCGFLRWTFGRKNLLRYNGLA